MVTPPGPSASEGINTTPPKSIKIFKLLQKACPVVGMIATAILFAGVYDFGVVNLTHQVSGFAGSALLTLILITLLGVVADKGITAYGLTEAEQQREGLLAKVETRILAVEEKAAGFLSEEYERVKTENENFRNEFQEIEVREKETIKEEIEALRLKNSKLLEQLNQQSTREVDVIIPEVEEPSSEEQAA